MLRVNLLPWRKRRMFARGARWAGLLMAGVLSVVALLALWAIGLQQLNQQRQGELQQLVNYHTSLQSQTEKISKLQQNYQRARRLQQHNQRRFRHGLQYVQLLHLLTEHVPAAVWITRFHQQGERLHIEGKSTAYLDIFALSWVLQTCSPLQDVRLNEVRQMSGNTLAFSIDALPTTVDAD